jgi:hypothetical protein
MYRTKSLRALVPLLVLTALSLACGFIPTPTPTPTPTNTPTSTPTPTETPTPTPTPTPTETPTPTPDPLPDKDTYTTDIGGYSIDYPGAWLVDDAPSTGGSLLAVIMTKEFFKSNGEEGAALLILSVPQTDPETTVDEWWENFESDMSSPSVSLGKPESIEIGGEDAIRAPFQDKVNEAQGWIAITIANEYEYAFIARVIPDTDWEEYELTLQAVLDSIEFFPPE